MNNKKQNPLLSVIIPCYNCAPVIRRCLDSIDYPDAEIIVVNDGSTDNSQQVVEEYIQRAENRKSRVKSIRLINKENGGVSSARNRGIEEAKGKYISFIDADDYIVLGGLGRIIEIAEQYDADVVKFKWLNVKDTAKQDISSILDVPIQIEQITGLEVLQRHDISDYIVWDGIYRRSVLVDSRIRFMTDLCLHEDDAFMGMLYCHARKVVVTNLPLYRYVVASNYSSTHRQTIEKQRNLIFSGLKAIRYRGQYVQKYFPQVAEVERLKYMRWVCPVRSAVEAEMTYAEYKSLLEEFRVEGVYPLDYTWIKVAGWDYAFKPYMKRAIQTFLVNHPWIGWPLAKLYYGRKKK